MKKLLVVVILVVVGVFLSSELWLKKSPFNSLPPPAYLESRLPKSFAQKLTTAPVHYLIDNVNILTMLNDSVFKGQVIVKGGYIDAIGTQLEASGLPIVDGQNGYLMPALSDMHVHLNNEEQLLLFLSQGVTMVRNLFGGPEHLHMRQQLSGGQWLGPQLITASPIFEGPDNFWPSSIRIKNQKDAIKEVVKAQAQGYDFIKVYHSLPLAQYQEILKVSDSLGIKVAGHLPQGWPAQDPLPKLWSFEHLSPRDFSKFIQGQSAEQTLNQFAKSATWHCPTLVVHRRLYDHTPEQWKDTAQKYLAPATLKSWEQTSFSSNQDYQQVLSLFGNHARGNSKILAGTDVLNPYVISGFSLHEELQEMVTAGLSPYQALKTATVNPGIFLEQPTGTIAEGQRADLLLLKSNPLEDIKHTQTIEAVAAQGKWMDRKFLNEMLNALAKN